MDVYEQEEGSKEKQINQLQRKIVSLNDRLKAADDMLISGTLSDQDYGRISEMIKQELNRKRRNCIDQHLIQILISMLSLVYLC